MMNRFMITLLSVAVIECYSAQHPIRSKRQYNWNDPSFSLFGADDEKQVKLEAAWKNAGQVVGIQIWRIVNFKAEQWPKKDNGEFFEGDSYIILNTYNENMWNKDALGYDVHVWIGKSSTSDEFSTAARKSIELDTFLGGKTIQHNEINSHESKLFKSYFEKGIKYLKGGADSGFIMT